MTREPVKLGRHVRHCNKVFWRHIFWGVNSLFLTSFVTSGRGNPKFWRCQNKAVVLFKDVQIKIQTRQKNSFYIRNVGHDRKDVKIKKIMYSTKFWVSRGKYIDLWGMFAFQAFTGPYRRFWTQKNWKLKNMLTSIFYNILTNLKQKFEGEKSYGNLKF